MIRREQSHMMPVIARADEYVQLNSDGFYRDHRDAQLGGMIIKNGIVLVDQINVESASGKAPYQAIFDSSVSRVRPVCMAAITTMLGLLPLLVLPVSYAFLYRIPNPS
ncbi:MAG: hypothetical protein ACI86X_002176 [Moritella sp.]|jgi:hypothetical protein